MTTGSCIKLKFDLSILSEIAEYARMFVYIWEDSDDNAEGKFGERWVPAGLNPVAECQKRVYNSIGVRKDRAKDGKITLIAILYLGIFSPNYYNYIVNYFV